MIRRFEWSEAKAASNERKHGVSFDLAATAFDDPLAIVSFDRVENHEIRWRTIGATRQGFRTEAL